MPIAIGSVTPVKLNCGLEIVAWVIESGNVPVFATATVWVACFPTLTLPKLTLVGLTWKAAWPVGVLVPVARPAQPPRIPVPRSAAVSRIESSFWRRLAGRCHAPIRSALAVPLVLIVFPSASFIT